jgi:hypothetical protein
LSKSRHTFSSDGAGYECGSLVFIINSYDLQLRSTTDVYGRTVSNTYILLEHCNVVHREAIT